MPQLKTQTEIEKGKQQKIVTKIDSVNQVLGQTFVSINI